jgi:predicted DNA binding protein
MTELAKELGVTPSTYSELLRKALKKVVKHYFDELI